MSVIKSIELVGSSSEGFEEAVKDAVAEAKKTIRNITRVTIEDMEAVIENDEIKSYQTRIKLFFTIERK